MSTTPLRVVGEEEGCWCSVAEMRRSGVAVPLRHAPDCERVLPSLAVGGGELSQRIGELEADVDRWRAFALEAVPLLNDLADGAEWTEAFQLAKKIRVANGEVEDNDA